VPVTAAVPEALVGQLDELAEKRGWNRSEAVTEAIRRLVKAKR
jgi:metal-responsive CopG/Arc/MetJ family transcriptional regulator